jgi:hypothetical protein
MRCGMSLHVAVVDPDHTGKENGEQDNEEQNEAKKVLVGEVAHKWQPCSTAKDTIVK